MKRFAIGPDPATELPLRQAAFIADPEAEPEEWTLPPGEHSLPVELQLGAPGRSLSLRGQPDTVLRVQQGGLQVSGERLQLSQLQLIADQADTAVLSVDGAEVSLDRVSASGGVGNSDGSALQVIARVSARLVQCSGTLRSGARGSGVTVSAPSAQLSGVDGLAIADDATGIRVAADSEALLSDCRSSGLRAQQQARGVVAVAPLIEALSVEVSDLRGGDCDGIALYALHGGTLSALDLRASGLDAGSGVCRGVFAVASGELAVSGFSVTGVNGRQAQGLTVVGGGAIDVGSGQVRDLRSTGTGAASTGGASGLRLLAGDAAAPVSLSDISIEAIGGSTPRAEARPQPGFAAWAAGIATTLADAAAATAFDERLLSTGPADADTNANANINEVVGLHLGAPADAVARVQRGQVAAVSAEDLVLHRIAGTALQLEAGLRALRLLRTELWTCARAGWVQAEQLLIAQTTIHRQLQPLRLGAGELRVLDSLFSGMPAGGGSAAPRLDPGAELLRVEAAFAAGATAPWRPLDTLPYQLPGPASVPPSLAAGVRPAAVAIDLALQPDHAISDAAVAVPGDPDPAFVGARAPLAAAGCGLEDPQPEPWRAPPRQDEDEPPLDYLARDAKSLLALMLERARTSMASWTEGGPSDLTQMLLELLAERLDHLAYEQERAVAEGFLDIARLRRSLEDHARPLDYRPDPGLSTTTMLRFAIDQAALTKAAARLPGGDPRSMPLFQAIADQRPVELPAGTLVANQDPDEGSILFATEALLSYLPELDSVPLTQTCPAGATSARLRGRLPRLERGRWLVLSRGRGYPGHVLRVTAVRLETDSTYIAWDPRRPTRHRYPTEGEDGSPARVFGNVVPAHHGLPLRALTDADTPDDLLGPWQALLEQSVDGSRVREVQLPLGPISVQAAGYPLPGEQRQGDPQLRLLVEGDEWRRVDDLSSEGPGREVFALRPGSTDEPVIRFGDGSNGAALPGREVSLRVDLVIGLGTRGNVGAFTLNRLIRFGTGSGTGTATGVLDPAAMISTTPGPERDDLIRAIWQVTNPLPGIGGRNPEPLERIRYRAPLQIRDALSAVAPPDYERLLLQLPEVSAARARVIDAGLRQLVRVTVLLADEDSLPEAELLRRWALVRRRLEAIRMLGFDVEAVPPVWLPLDIDLVVDATAFTDPGRLRAEVREAVAGNGGLLDPDSTGLGGDVHVSDLFQAVQRLSGVQAVRVKHFRRLAPRPRDYLDAGVIPIAEHEVATVGGPRNPGAGLLTVSVCGGLQ